MKKEKQMTFLETLEFLDSEVLMDVARHFTSKQFENVLIMLSLVVTVWLVYMQREILIYGYELFMGVLAVSAWVIVLCFKSIMVYRSMTEEIWQVLSKRDGSPE